ncbi:serine/threonine-protein phosphatase 6 regulatory ankyrin repeat subunit B-like [Mya arenaria]|uniref:serine/threonine-protein phosphatase 6 regulatory ankyrin repeat subunit B-like n=1 Tax=Mya arenaria TaxID=6604 RepID=UPI0022E16631|nr:serine/threonine-protein phosphatase 6 regulatory ankyrin repeat subunit B-like [Mya arenaria]
MNFEEAYPDTIGSVALAARAGDERSLRKLLRNGRPADVKDNRGWIAVHEAAYFGHDKCLNQLLQRNIAFATAETFESQTPLHLACSRGHAACVKILLQTGADPNAETKENYTPLWHAVSCNIDCVKLLVDAGALVNHQIYTKETALHRAVNKGKTDIVCYLIGQNADITLRDENGLTPLFISAQMGRLGCVEALVNKAKEKGNKFLKKYVNTPAADGATPLYLSAQGAHLECLKILVDNYANPNIPVDVEDFNIYPFQVALYGSARLRKKAIDCAEILGSITNMAVFKWSKYAPQVTRISKCYMHPLTIALGTDQTGPMKLLMNLKEKAIHDFFKDDTIPVDAEMKTNMEPAVILIVNGMGQWLFDYMERSSIEISIRRDFQIQFLLCRLCCMLGKYPSFIEDWLEYHQIVDCTNKWAVAKTEIMLAGLLKYYKPEPCDDCKDNKYDFCVENIDLRLSDEDSNHDLEYFRNPLITGAQYDDEPVYENHEELLAPLMELKHLSRRAVVLNMMHRGTFTQTGIESLDIPVHMKEYISLTDIDHPIQNLHLRASKEAHRIEKEIDQFLEQEDKDGVIPRSPVEYEGNPTANIKHKQDIFYMESVVKNFLQDPTMFAWVPDQSMIEEDMYVANDNEDS